MSILTSDLTDFKSSAASSDGGAISATKVKVGMLSAAVLTTDTTIPVYDSSPFAVNDVIVFDDGATKQEKTISSIPNGTSIVISAAIGTAYVKDTPFGAKQNLFPNVIASESEAGLTRYRKFFRKNAHATLTLTLPRNYINNQVENAALALGFGLDHADDGDGGQGNMVALAADDTVQVLSDGADTRQVTISGLKASDGSFISETLTLNGVTAVTSTNTFKAGGVVRAYVSALDAARSVTIRRTTGATTLGTIGINKKISFLWFGKKITAGAIANAEGGDIPGGATIDATNSILFADVAATSNIPFWCRYMCAAGSAAAGNSTGNVATKGETT